MANVFGQWEEAGVPGETPSMHGENMQTPHRNPIAVLSQGPSCCEARALTTAPPRSPGSPVGHLQPIDCFTCFEQGCQFSSSSTNRQEYQSHLTSKHGLDLIPCTSPSCTWAFPTPEEMEGHRESHLPFGCFCCPFVAQTAKALRDHLVDCNRLYNNPDDHWQHFEDQEMIRVGPKTILLCLLDYLAEGAESVYRTHTCPKCRRCFKMRSHLQEHLRLHFPDPSLQCPTCERYFTSRSKLRVHRLREAGEKTQCCNMCEYTAVERNAIRRHLASVHTDEAERVAKNPSFVCPSCGKNFTQARVLKAHMKTHNIPSDSRSLACFQESCSYQTFLRKELIIHAAEMHGVKAVECRHRACGAIFQSKAHMEAHHQKHLAYHCTECEFSCSNKTVFLRHQRDGHPGKEELCCSFCSFVTFNPVQFEQHLGHLHANEKIHHCSQCSYSTSHKRGLKRHMLMHSGEKPHKCTLCDFRCRDESYLSKHMLTHSDDKNFMCSECGYVTKWKHYLTVHMRKHFLFCAQSFNKDYVVFIAERKHTECQISTPEEENSTLQHNMHLKAMKKHDMDQAETMVPEGQVKMLVVQSETTYQCDKCSYVTCKERAFRHHRQALCHKKMKVHTCQTCGVQFKQRRGLHNHLSTTCPSHSRKAFLQDSNPCQDANAVSTEGYEEPKGIDGHRRSNEMQQKEIFINLKSNSEALISSVPQQQKITNQAKKGSNFEVLKRSSSFSLSNKLKYSKRNVFLQEKNTYIKKKGAFICRLCRFTSGTLQTVRQHMLTHRETCNKIENQTSAEMVSEYLLPRHRKGHAEKNMDGPQMGQVFRCPNCAFRCSKKNLLDNHEETGCMKAGEVQCTECSFVAASKVSLTRHVLCTHKKKVFFDAKWQRLRCQHCAFSCRHKGIMERHILLKHKGARRTTTKKDESLRSGIRCYCSNMCDFSAYTPHSLRRHSHRCHSRDLPHVCTHCDAPFSSDIALRNHCKRSHSLQVSFSCKQCDFTCARDGLLKAHQLSKHPRVKCTTCQKSFETEKSLEIHQRAHHVHRCQSCPFSSKTKQLLADHLLSKHEEGSPESKPLKCSICPFWCRHHLVLEQHLRSHGSKRMYKCTDCQYSTRNKQKITWHIRIHTGEKPYSCEQCTYTCADPSRLKVTLGLLHDLSL
uniref:Zinc finger protein 142 n=1 Tax=Oryzias latipes TaxID=8090 RepID=A0A3P9J086_ORYLA